MSLSVVLVNFNGLRLLETHFASIVDAISREISEPEFIVVDNASMDGSLDWLKHNHPQVKLLKQDINRYFASAANIGISAAQNDLVLLLNEDVHAVLPRIAEIELCFRLDPRLFALSPRLIDPRDGSQEKLFRFLKKRGLVDLVEPERFELEQEQEIPYGTGGALFLRRKAFLQLGGFREVYAPFYWDDPDLGIRAWSDGWRTLYFPRSQFHHFHSSTISSIFGKNEIRRAYEKNRLVFMYLNLQSTSGKINYSFWLPLRLIWSLLTDRIFWIAWFDFLRAKRAIEKSWKGQRDSIIKKFEFSRRG